ncbi:hypothetical protein EMIHUDRAFT_106729 [Emiliania huxleyi CCMP1516]|uniref:Nucleotide-diphospho-sugar transferase domain-containing protein n=2 Tax=Emiliania huxleyi TaxID=2903 RepID=A0A0D3I6B4_EMIH1|nr:hypothetical protein EMIHUDRAFT_106729 [Emiliania huxleyi CCMP1516]EOD06799.1 hypothetical protein EMIHUDRAFT_106729 [Emiliania huxleyi CCMP1516]|eukprot:XP_005759228.1 hypothetical protein EMIHUDRAFT_106729 [Emiliania huxleyi CCMP1516]
MPRHGAFPASACPCSESGCFQRPAADWAPLQCRASSLCGRALDSAIIERPADADSGRVTILTVLSYTPNPDTPGDFSRYLHQFRSLVNLLHSLLLTATTLPVHTLVTTRYAEFEERLQALKARMLPVAPLAPPAWARKIFAGTFDKLQAVSLVQFDKVIFLDNDCQVLRNIDHLAYVDAPAAVFHSPDALQPQGGINSGMMVLRPSREAAAEVIEAMRSLPADTVVDGSDQAVWHAYFKRHPVYELPRGYNFRTNTGILDRDRCLAYIIHHVDKSSRQGTLKPEIMRSVYTRTGCWPLLMFPDALRLKVDANATAWNERFRHAPPLTAEEEGSPDGVRDRSLLRPVLAPGNLVGGLFNQIFALIGCCLVAHATGSALLLPEFTSHVLNGAVEPFGALFDEERFRRGMRAAGLRVLRKSTNARRTWSASRAGRTSGTSNSWPYLDYFYSVRERRRRMCTGLHPLETAAWRSLRPAPPIAREAARFRATAGLRESYGCVHARIERDMLFSADRVGAGPPPTLAQLQEGMAAVPALHGAREVFVAVGKNVPRKADEKMLASGRTAWGARFARTATGARVSYDSRWSSANSSYTRAAVLDFAVCRGAAWFVGWPGSSFSQGLAIDQQVNRGAPWYAACPLGQSCHDPAKVWKREFAEKTCTTRMAAELLTRRTDGGADDKLCVANRSWVCTSGGGGTASDADLKAVVEAMKPPLLPVGMHVAK